MAEHDGDAVSRLAATIEALCNEPAADAATLMAGIDSHRCKPDRLANAVRPLDRHRGEENVPDRPLAVDGNQGDAPLAAGSYGIDKRRLVGLTECPLVDGTYRRNVGGPLRTYGQRAFLQVPLWLATVGHEGWMGSGKGRQ